jgi:gluconate 2-dehydrogenase gamma chain
MAADEPHDTPVSIGRREALKAAAVTAAAAALPATAAASSLDAQPPARRTAAARALPVAGPRGTPTDPDLINPKADWPRLLSAKELATLAVLCDLIIPADGVSPGASAVGVPAYINEHVSAPYDWAEQALVRVRGGLVWLDTESGRRFGRPFAKLTLAEQTQIADDICFFPDAKPQFKAGARFFGEVRNLTQTAFYTSDAGMKDIGYVGNVALPKWELPPKAVLDKLGLS